MKSLEKITSKGKEIAKYVVAPILGLILFAEGITYLGSQSQLSNIERNSSRVAATGRALNGLNYLKESPVRKVLGFGAGLSCKHYISRFKNSGGDMVAAERYALEHPDLN